MREAWLGCFGVGDFLEFGVILTLGVGLCRFTRIAKQVVLLMKGIKSLYDSQHLAILCLPVGIIGLPAVYFKSLRKRDGTCAFLVGLTKTHGVRKQCGRRRRSALSPFQHTCYRYSYGPNWSRAPSLTELYPNVPVPLHAAPAVIMQTPEILPRQTDSG